MNASLSWTPTSDLLNGGIETDDTPVHHEILNSMQNLNEVAIPVPFDLWAVAPTPGPSLNGIDDKDVPAQDLAMALAFLDSPNLGLWDSFELRGQGQEDFLNFPNALDLSLQSWLQPGHMSQSLNSSGPSSSISPCPMDLSTGFPHSSGDEHASSSQLYFLMDFQLAPLASSPSTAPSLANPAIPGSRVRSHSEAFDEFESDGENDEGEPREPFWKRLRLDDDEMDLDLEGPSVGQTHGGTSQAQRHLQQKRRRLPNAAWHFERNRMKRPTLRQIIQHRHSQGQLDQQMGLHFQSTLNVAPAGSTTPSAPPSYPSQLAAQSNDITTSPTVASSSSSQEVASRSSFSSDPPVNSVAATLLYSPVLSITPLLNRNPDPRATRPKNPSPLAVEWK